MGIGWLWCTLYRSDNSVLRTENEKRAASTYAQWRRLCNGISWLAERWEQHRLHRAIQSAFSEFPAWRLDDVGMQRLPNGTIVAVSKAPKPINKRQIDCCRKTERSQRDSGARLFRSRQPIPEQGSLVSSGYRQSKSYRESAAATAQCTRQASETRLRTTDSGLPRDPGIGSTKQQSIWRA